MIYVQVHLKGAPGGFQNLQNEIGEYNRLMTKEGGKPIANFVVRVGEGTGDQVHLFAYDDMAAYAAAMDKMGSDPEWQAFLGRVGSLASGVDLSILRPLPESGLR
ncbi:MAG: NIPSNAP family protein [Pseudomonadales bacterium]